MAAFAWLLLMTQQMRSGGFESEAGCRAVVNCHVNFAHIISASHSIFPPSHPHRHHTPSRHESHHQPAGCTFLQPTLPACLLLWRVYVFPHTRACLRMMGQTRGERAGPAKAKKRRASGTKHRSRPKAVGAKRARILKGLEQRFGSVARAAATPVKTSGKGKARTQNNPKPKPKPKPKQQSASAAAGRGSRRQDPAARTAAGTAAAPSSHALYELLTRDDAASLHAVPDSVRDATATADLRQAAVRCLTEEVLAGPGKLDVREAMKTKLSKPLLLDNARQAPSLVASLRRQHARLLRQSGGGRRRLPPPSTAPTYADCMGLHKLWNAYMARVVSSGPAPDVLRRVLRADLHGAVATVARSSSPSLVGACGVVIRVGKQAVDVVTTSNKLLVLPLAQVELHVAVPSLGTVSLCGPRHGRDAVE